MIELKQNKKSLESQKKIYKALRQILLSKPLCEITVSDIKNECDISRTTFYRNFYNVVDVLDVMINYFYNRYLVQRKDVEDQILFFFQYWNHHKDLIYILTTQNKKGLEACIKRHNLKIDNPYSLAINYVIFTCFIARWSISKKETPEEMVEITKKYFNQKISDILFNFDDQTFDLSTYI